MRKHGLRALGLSLMAALSLMAFSSSAQAVTGEWTIEGVGVLQGTESIKGVQDSTAPSQLLKSIAGKAEILIHCEEFSTDDGLIYGAKEVAPKPAGTSLATILYKKCITKLAGKESIICKPVEPIEAKVRNLLVLDSAKNYILFEPHEAGKPFAEIKFGTGECSVPTTPVTGSIVFQCEEPAGTQVDCATLRKIQLISPAPAALFEADKLSFGVNPATLTGSAKLELSGGNAGKAWGGKI